MKITCPECGFSREVPENKIPDTAIRATCPKCGVKFSFRKPAPEPEFLLEDEVGPVDDRPDETVVEQPYEPSSSEIEDVRETQNTYDEPADMPSSELPGESPRGSQGGWTEESFPAQPSQREDVVPQDSPEPSFPEESVQQNNLSRLTRGLDPEEYEEPADATGREANADAPDAREEDEGRFGSADGPVAPRGDSVQDEMQDDRHEQEEQPAGNGGDIWQKLESLDIPDEAGSDDVGGDMPTPRRKRQDVRVQDAPQFRERRTSSEQENPDETPVVDVPWERLDRYGFFGGLTQTIKRAMLNPRLFFETMPLRGGMLRPLAFYMLIYLFETLCQYVWGMAGFTTSGLFTGTEMGADMVGGESMLPANAEAQLLVFVYPVFFTLLLFAGSGINHLFLLAVQSGKGGFEGTFRALAYSSAPMVLSFIPVIGPMIGAFWSFAITFIAFKSVHRTTYVKVFIAFMLPIVILLGMSLLVAVGANHSV